MKFDFVVSGAQLKCTCGSFPGTFQATNYCTKIEDKNYGTEEDDAPITNIPAFGHCGPRDGPCSPQPMNWENTDPLIKINKKHVLLYSSTIPCSQGGLIQFVDQGQGKAKKNGPCSDNLKNRIAKFDEQIKKASQQTGISENQIRAQIAQESRGFPLAEANKETLNSAKGLMQVNKETWDGVTQKYKLGDLDFYENWSDPEKNILVGSYAFQEKQAAITNILKNMNVQASPAELHKMVVTSYNAGQGTVQKALKAAQSDGKNPVQHYLDEKYMKEAIKATGIFHNKALEDLAKTWEGYNEDVKKGLEEILVGRKYEEVKNYYDNGVKKYLDCYQQ